MMLAAMLGGIAMTNILAMNSVYGKFANTKKDSKMPVASIQIDAEVLGNLLVRYAALDRQILVYMDASHSDSKQIFDLRNDVIEKERVIRDQKVMIDEANATNDKLTAQCVEQRKQLARCKKLLEKKARK